MEITNVRKQVLRLPRVSTFVYMNSPTIHHKCKTEVQEREKDYGRPTLVAKPCQRKSSWETPIGLSKLLLETPDLIHELALGHARAQKASKAHLENKGPSRLGSKYGINKSLSMFDSKNGQPSSIIKDHALATWDSTWSINHHNTLPHANQNSIPDTSFHSFSPIADVQEDMQGLLRDRKIGKEASKVNLALDKGMLKVKEITHVPRRKRSSFIQKYTLDTFLNEMKAKQKETKDVDFSEKDHALWHMGVAQGDLKTGYSEDVKYYKNKFQQWARGVLARERDLFGFSVYDDEIESPSFVTGSPQQKIIRLEQGPGPQSKNRKLEKDTMILDIGALQPGDYFGERGLLKKARRAVSIVTICPVEVLVLNVWDFHRHCDRDIITALSQNDYKKEEQVYRKYLRNCRWERFKKKCLDDIVDDQNYRKCLRLGPRGMRYIPTSDNLNSRSPRRSSNEWK